MKLTTRQMERFHTSMADVQKNEPGLSIGGMNLYQLHGLMCRVAVHMDIIADYPKGTDVDDIPPAVANQIGEEFNDAYTIATTIPKKNG